MNESKTTQTSLGIDEEVVLMRRMRDGKEEEQDAAADALFAAYTGYIASIVMSITKAPHCDSESADDLMNAGKRGLLKAIRKYDFGRATPLSKFASKYISGEILAQMRAEGSTIARPRGVIDDLKKINKARGRLHAVGNTNPTADEIVEEVLAKSRIPRERIVRALESDRRIIRLDAPTSRERRVMPRRVVDMRGTKPASGHEDQDESDGEAESREWQFTLEDLGCLSPTVASQVVMAMKHNEEHDRLARFNIAVLAADRCYRRRKIFAECARGRLDEASVQFLTVAMELPDVYHRRALWKRHAE